MREQRSVQGSCWGAVGEEASIDLRSECSGEKGEEEGCSRRQCDMKMQTDCRKAVCTGQAVVVLVASVISLRVLKPEEDVAPHVWTWREWISGDGARSSELLNRWYEAAVGYRRRKVRVSLQRYSGTRERSLHYCCEESLCRVL